MVRYPEFHTVAPQQQLGALLGRLCSHFKELLRRTGSLRVDVCVLCHHAFLFHLLSGRVGCRLTHGMLALPPLSPLPFPPIFAAIFVVVFVVQWILSPMMSMTMFA